MAVPTVTVIHPPTGPTGGRRLVQIMGGNFQLPPDPPALGPVGDLAPTVEVLFGGVPATHVQVASRARLFCVTPITPLPASAPSGTVDVEVRNIDANGDLIPGETVTVADGYTYERPDLNARPDSDLVRLCRTLLHQFKKQLLANTSIDTHTDWSDDPSSGLTYIAEVPAIVLLGPDLPENRFHSTNQRRYEDNTFGLGDGFFEALRPPYTSDVVFGILGVDDKKLRGITLQGQILQFFQRNKTISMLRDESDPSLGEVSWEMDWLPGGLRRIGGPNSSNIRTFQGRFAIKGFDLDDASMATYITRETLDQFAEGSVEEPVAVVIEEPEQLGSSS